MSLRQKHCRVVKAADTPSCLGGADKERNVGYGLTTKHPNLSYG